MNTLDAHALIVHALGFASGQLAARISLQCMGPIAGPSGLHGRGCPGVAGGGQRVTMGLVTPSRGSVLELPARVQHCAGATEVPLVPQGPSGPLSLGEVHSQHR